MSGKKKLYLIEILHQTTTEALVIVIGWKLYLIEILHQTTTLLLPCSVLRGCILSKFYIKPQQTSYHCLVCRRCILSKFYIKPQRHNPRRYGTSVVSYRNSTSNHNFVDSMSVCDTVVSYRNSTSNHNETKPLLLIASLYLIEILHQTTTEAQLDQCREYVVSYRNSTSNHNAASIAGAGIIVVSYRNSTSNHNSRRQRTR